MSILFLLQSFVHYTLHLIFPVFIAKVFFKSYWKKAYFILLATMLVDLDHLLATPVFDPSRCSVGFHPLHSFYAIAVYFGLLMIKGVPRVLAIGLLLHMATDAQDCLWK